MSSKFLNANTDVTLSENSDLQIPSQKAVKTYVDNKTSVLATKGELTTGLSEKQDVISDLDTIRQGAALGATALQAVPDEYVTESELAAKNYATTTDLTTGLSTKQDTISDLSTIREGAALGATSVQHEDLSEVAISGMYSDLTGKPGAATTDTLGLVKVDGTTITATADGVISAKGDSGAKRSIGEVYFSQSSLASDNPGALPLFTGETIASANTIYPDFYSWVSNHPELCCTLDSYNASIKTFGECPKYVVGNDEIELPVAWDPSKANLSEAFDYYTDFALLELDGKNYVSVNVDSVMYYTANKNISTDSVMQLYTDVELTKKAYIRYKASKNVYTKPIGLQIVTIKGITKAYIKTGTAGNYGSLYGTSGVGVLGFNTTDYTSLSVETGAIKLPLIKNYIKAANTADGITQGSAGLPNITGQTGVNTTGGIGAFSNTVENIKGTVAISGYNTTTTTSNFDASRSSAVYGASDTVTPAHTTLYPWVVAYTAAIPASTAQAAEFQNALSGKVDLPTGKTQSDVDFVVESYSDDSGNWYRVYKSGWVEQGGHMNVPAQTTEYNFFKPYASNVKVTLFCGRYTLNFSTAMTNERIYAVAGTPCIKFGINNGSNTTEGMFWRAEGQGA